MRVKDITKGLKTFLVRLRIPHGGTGNIFNTTIQARTAEQARRILRAQYNDPKVVVGIPREIKRH
jgi:hypothetical protein